MTPEIEQALIFTSKGNLPLSSLKEVVNWVDNEDETTCVVEHWLNDECVKRAIHIYYRKPTILAGTAGAF